MTYRTKKAHVELFVFFRKLIRVLTYPSLLLLIPPAMAGAAADNGWMNLEGKRPWIDLPYSEWPIFKQDTVRVVTKKVGYIDTKIRVDASLFTIVWLDNKRFFINYGKENTEGESVASSDIFDMDKGVLKEFSKDKYVKYVDHRSGIIDTAYSQWNAKEKDKIYQFKEGGNGVFEKYNAEFEINRSNEYQYSTAPGACFPKYTPPGDVRLYIKYRDCGDYISLKRMASGLEDFYVKLFRNNKDGGPVYYGNVPLN